MNGIDDVLIINSYAGSLTLAATALDLPVRAVMEDSGYGIAIQKKNFGDKYRWVDSLPWPKWDLSRTMVIAHPPCSAFSVQTAANAKIHGHDSAKIVGLTSDAFACTQRIMDYAMSQNARCLLIESVPRAMEGARKVHDAVSKRYGYSAFRVMQNAATFGVPQWRERFWIAFAKTDRLTLRYTPRIAVLRDVLASDSGDAKATALLGQKSLLRQFGLSDKRIEKLLEGPPYGKLSRLIGIENDDRDGKKRWCTGGAYDTAIIRTLDPGGFAPIVMTTSIWTYEGKQLSHDNYKRIMGFPADYKMPNSASMKTYLTKGVVPPVAEWLLDNIVNNANLGPEHTLMAGKTLDLRVTRADPTVLRFPGNEDLI